MYHITASKLVFVQCFEDKAFAYLCVYVFVQILCIKIILFFLDDKSNSLPFLRLVLKIRLLCTYYSSELIVL